MRPPDFKTELFVHKHAAMATFILAVITAHIRIYRLAVSLWLPTTMLIVRGKISA